MKPADIRKHPIHLGLGATAMAEPAFDGTMAWYEAYEARHAADGAEGRLVSLFSFAEPWGSWEMHPYGEEVVVCVSGALILHHETPDGTRTKIALKPGEYAINPRGVWHTADTDQKTTALFITAGQGTEHRPR